MKKIIVLLTVLMFILMGCSSGSSFTSINGDKALELVSKDEAIIIDVRSIPEYENRHIKGAVNIPVDNIDISILEELITSKQSNIIVYCASGNRSKRAANIISQFGYTNVFDLGSINVWSGEFE